MLGKKFKLLTITLLTLLSTATFAAVHTQYSSTVCSNTPYLFGCDKLTTNGAHSNTLGDSTVTVNLTFGALKATAYTATIEPGQTYLFGCQKLTADATETNTLQQVGCECDSTVTLTLTVQAPAPTPTSVTVAYTANIYDGETYLFGCQKLTVAGPYTETFQRVGGGDSIVNLTLNVNPMPVQDVTVAYTADIFDGETYLFGCQKLTVAGPYTETFQRVGGGDSIVNLTLNVNPVPVQKVTVEYNSEIEVGQTYLFGCQKYTYTETGLQTLKDSVQAVNGGDSIIIVHLTVSAGGAAQKDTVVGYTTSIYTGETYLFGCEKLTTAGVYKDTLQRDNVIGDSIVVLTLNVVEPSVTVAYTANIYDGETYLFGCQKLTAAGPYTETFQRAAGGDSIVNLTLNVNPIPDVTVAYNATIKQGETYLFGCQKLTAAGPYTETFQRVGGGDSIVNLTLAVNNVTYGDTTASYCGPWTWYEHTCDATDDYVHTFIGANIYGGDSIVTLHFTLLNASIGIDTIASNCGPMQWYEHTCDADSDYVHTFTNAVGCDSVVTMHFTLLSPATGTDSIDGCDSVIFKGVTYYADATVLDTIIGGAANTCDSIVTVKITIKHPVTTGVDAIDGCDSVTFKGIKYYANATVLDTIIGGAANGCDSIVTVTITIKHPVTGNDVIDGCDSVIFKGIKYYANATVLDTIIGGAANGCDSIVTITIMVKPHAIGNDVIDGCDTVTFKGIKYTANATVLDTIVNGAVNGCDSIVTVSIIVKHSTVGDTTAIECDEFTWYGIKYTESAKPTHTLKNAAGCDSIVTLDLTIHHKDSTILTPIDTCNMYRWKTPDIDTLITTTGLYQHMFQTIHGCDSLVKLDVTIRVPYLTTLDLIHKFGDRLLMINRNQINKIDGWQLDSLDVDHPEYVSWYKENPAGEDEFLTYGYSYSMPNGDPIPAGTYYAVVNIPGKGGNCGAIGTTMHYTVKGTSQAPELVPTLARPGEEITVLNLNPDAQTVIRIYSAEGIIQTTYTSVGSSVFRMPAADGHGFYLVEIVSEDEMKSTLRYIVK